LSEAEGGDPRTLKRAPKRGNAHYKTGEKEGGQGAPLRGEKNEKRWEKKGKKPTASI